MMSPQLPPAAPRSARFFSRLTYAILALGTLLLGLASRHFRAQLPAWVGLYAGDALWALLVFWLISALGPRGPLVRRAGLALGFAVLIEVSQLWQAPGLLALRAHPLGALVLGRGFRWSDLLCYAAGVLLGCVLEHWGSRRAAWWQA